MGQFEFDVSASLVCDHGLWTDQSFWKGAYICGLEQVPRATEVRFQDGRILVSQQGDHSGKLVIPCRVAPNRVVMLSTCSLLANAAPRNLALELARGSFDRVRSQADIWQRSGLRLPTQFLDQIDQGSSLFLDATCSPSFEDSAGLAQQAIESLETAGAILADAYATQVLEFRQNNEGSLGTLMAGSIHPAGIPDKNKETLYLEAFNSVALQVAWPDTEPDAGRFDFAILDKAVDWCNSHDLQIIAGPLIDFQEGMLPPWLSSHFDDFDAFVDLACQFAERVAQRYSGRISLWNCAAGFNSPGPFQLTETKRMQLIVRLLQTVRQVDGRTPVVLSFDQPWGEYLRNGDESVLPIRCADALVRTDLQLAGFGLDIQMNYQQTGTVSRNVLDLSHMLDRWSLLGQPLLCRVAIPASTQADSEALRWGTISNEKQSNISDANQQATLASAVIRTMLAKTFVHGIVWDGWDDSKCHTFPNSGILQRDGKTRPLHKFFSNLQTEYFAARENEGVK